jgi:gluconolactonase
MRVTGSGAFDVVLEYDGAPNGLAESEGQVVIADGDNGLIWAERRDGALVPRRALGAWHDGPFLGVNDLVIDDDGSVFFTDQGMTGLHDASGRLLHLAADGTRTTLLTSIPSPNGLALAPTGGEVLVAVTRDNAIWRVPYDDQLQPYRVGRYVQLSGGTGPDGIALGDGGELFIAHLGLGVVWMIDDRGRVRGGFEAPDGRSTTNVAYSPADRVIYVTEADTGTVLVGDTAAAH